MTIFDANPNLPQATSAPSGLMEAENQNTPYFDSQNYFALGGALIHRTWAALTAQNSAEPKQTRTRSQGLKLGVKNPSVEWKMGPVFTRISTHDFTDSTQNPSGAALITLLTSESPFAPLLWHVGLEGKIQQDYITTKSSNAASPKKEISDNLYLGPLMRVTYHLGPWQWGGLFSLGLAQEKYHRTIEDTNGGESTDFELEYTGWGLRTSFEWQYALRPHLSYTGFLSYERSQIEGSFRNFKRKESSYQFVAVPLGFRVYFK
jgi:hypothetical protein